MRRGRRNKTTKRAGTTVTGRGEGSCPGGIEKSDKKRGAPGIYVGCLKHYVFICLLMGVIYLYLQRLLMCSGQANTSSSGPTVGTTWTGQVTTHKEACGQGEPTRGPGIVAAGMHVRRRRRARARGIGRRMKNGGLKIEAKRRNSKIRKGRVESNYLCLLLDK